MFKLLGFIIDIFIDNRRLSLSVDKSLALNCCLPLLLHHPAPPAANYLWFKKEEGIKERKRFLEINRVRKTGI